MGDPPVKWSDWLEGWGFGDADPEDVPVEELEGDLDQWYNDSGSGESEFELQGWALRALHRLECSMPICLIDLETGIPIGRIDYEQWLEWVGI